MTRIGVIAAILLVVGGLSACGDGNPATPALGAGVSERLSSEVATIRAAAERSDRSAAEDALAELRTTVAELRRTGQITGGRSAEVLAAAVDVEAELVLLPTTTTSSSTTSTTRRGKGPGKKD